jgi:hypothetical protein
MASLATRAFFWGAVLAVGYAVFSAIGLGKPALFTGLLGQVFSVYMLVSCLYTFVFALVHCARNTQLSYKPLWIIGMLLITVPVAVLYVSIHGRLGHGSAQPTPN